MIRNLLKKTIRTVKRIHKSKSPLSQVPCIDSNRFLFLGGLHRSGTSILHRLFREHPSASGFVNTGVPEDEGQHLQTVFPPAYKYGGAGAFAFDLRSHLTEESALITPENREKLLREWGAYHDLNKKVLLEKSPPNLVRSRFLQALFPEARFVFLVRHPLAVSLATTKSTDTSITELLLHWQVAYSIMLMDLGYLKRYSVIRYEDFVESPQVYLDQICELVGIETFMPKETIVNHNLGYFALWKQKYSKEREVIETMFPLKQSPVKIFGYSFSEPYVGSY